MSVASLPPLTVSVAIPSTAFANGEERRAPANRHELLRSLYADEYIEKEKSALMAKRRMHIVKLFALIPRSEVPKATKILCSHWVYACDHDNDGKFKYRSRPELNGNPAAHTPRDERFSAAMVYAYQLPGYCVESYENWAMSVLKAWYRHSQAGRRYQKDQRPRMLSEQLEMEQNIVEPCSLGPQLVPAALAGITQPPQPPG